MKLQLFRYKCQKCKHVFQAPKLGAGSYGEFLLRSENKGTLAFLNALSDPIYVEASDLLADNLDMKNKDQLELAEILQKIFGVCCDSDEGNVYKIGLNPICLSCGSQEMLCWEEIEPPQFVEIEVPHVTHRCWAALSKAEKSILLNNSLR